MSAVATIREAGAGDAEAVWEVIGPVFRSGETYAVSRSISQADALAYWLGPDRETFVAEVDGIILGTYYLRANYPGGGSHVCNSGYVTAPSATGRGIARQMHEHSVARARRSGFRAMQFNFVVSSNARAVALWQSLGFETVGRLPGAFLHPSLGYVDAFVMFKTL